MRSLSCRRSREAETLGHLTAAPIDPAVLTARIESPAHGAIASFVGQVRNHHGGRAVGRLEYSAYGPMAEAECQRIVREAEAEWPVRVALEHRVGGLEIGDIAVAIAVSAPHRDEAFAACRFVIEAVKRRVPIWKKEHYLDGAVAWVDPTGSPLDEVPAS
ncbi:MAG: molybdenum cofactor biosynthesis protein MoaE [Gemmatimonadales bacterium]|nr:molybdenum cofactor biosynthesis protein MoaE [Gemmatimonadales bacterium]